MRSIALITILILAVGNAATFGWGVWNDQERKRAFAQLDHELSRIDRLERELEDWIRHQKQKEAERQALRGDTLPEFDLEKWKKEIDLLVEEQYGEILRLSLSDAQVRQIVTDLREDVANGGFDPDDPALKDQLSQIVGRMIGDHLEEKGLTLRKKPVSLREIADRIGLRADQAPGFETIFADARTRFYDLVRTPLSDGTDLLAEFQRLESLPLHSEDRRKLNWELLKRPLGDGGNLQSRLVGIEEDLRGRMRGLLTDEQWLKFNWLPLVPADLYGISLDLEK